jgi:uncharacterized glyoxalase superfamily protein PhnB
MGFEAITVSASLTVRDVLASRNWYRDVLGFEVDYEYERGGAVRAVALRAGDVKILVNQDDGAKGLDRPKGDGFSLMFTTSQDIDTLAGGIVERGATLDAEPATTPWGVRAFRLTDPDGFKLVFSSPR